MASSSTTSGSALQETIVGGTDAGGRKGEVLSKATDPDGTTAGNGWINVPYFNVWGEQKRGKPTFFPTRICEGTQNRTYDYPAWRLNNATPPSGMTLNYGEKGVTDRSFVDGSDPKNFLAPYRFFQKDADFDQAAEILIESGRGSVSLLQRRLAIGYGRASRLVDLMGQAGLLGEHKGSQAREVVVTMEEWQRMKAIRDKAEREGTVL
jgi:DNA segregation ATPase FtsK/SpoIIIE-like protein